MSEWEPPKPTGTGNENDSPEGGHDWKSATPPTTAASPEPPQPETDGIPLSPAVLPPMPGDEVADWLTSGAPIGGVGDSGWQPPATGEGGWLPPSGPAPTPPAGGGGWLPPTGPIGAGGPGTPAGGGWQPPGGGTPPGGGWQPPGGGTPPGGGGWQPPGGGDPSWGAGALAAEAGAVRVGDILSSASRVVAGNVGTFVVVALAASLPGLVVTQLFQHRLQRRMLAAQADLMQNNLGGGDPLGILGAMFDPVDIAGICGGAFLNFVLTYLAQGVLVYSTIEHLAGRRVPVGAAVSRGIASAPSILGAALLVALIQFVSVLPGFGVGALLFAAGPAGACCGAGFMLFGMLIPMFWVLIATFVAIPTAVSEQVGPVTALQRSFELTKGHRLTILLVFLSLVGVLFVFGCFGGVCSGAAGGSNIDLATGLPKEPSALSEGLNFVVSLLVAVLQTTALSALAAVTYARIRGVKDGVDANALADVFS